MSRGVVRRQDLAMSPEDVEDLLRRAAVGHFATVGADGEPYVVPNLFVYAERRLYLHSAGASGHFRANIAHRPRVCFETAEMAQVFAYGGFACDTSASYVSVVGFGAIGIVAEATEKARFFDRFMAKYADAAWDRPKGFYPRLGQVTVYCIEPERITGKKVALPPLGEQWPARNRTKSPGAVPPSGS